MLSLGAGGIHEESSSEFPEWRTNVCQEQLATLNFLNQLVEFHKMNSRKRTICQHIYCTYVQIMYYGHYEMGNLHILLCMVNWRMREKNVYVFIFSSVQLLSHVRLFVTSWTAARQASLSITNSWSLPKLMSIVSDLQTSQRQLQVLQSC